MKFDPQIHHRHSIRLKDYDYTLPGPYFITLVTQHRANLFGEITDGVMCLDHFGEIIQSTWLRLPVYFPIDLDSWVIMPNHLHAILWITNLGRGEASVDQLDEQPWDTSEDASPLHHPVGIPPFHHPALPLHNPPPFHHPVSPLHNPAGTSPLHNPAGTSPLHNPSPLHHPAGTSRGSLGAIIQNFKTITTRKIHALSRGEASIHQLDRQPWDTSEDDSPHHPRSSPTIDRIWQRNYYDHIIRNQKELDQIRQYILENPHMWCEDQENMERSPK
jgi:putative transposase